MIAAETISAARTDQDGKGLMANPQLHPQLRDCRIEHREPEEYGNLLELDGEIPIEEGNPSVLNVPSLRDTAAGGRRPDSR